jgi:hypothetical protein
VFGCACFITNKNTDWDSPSTSLHVGQMPTNIEKYRYITTIQIFVHYFRTDIIIVQIFKIFSYEVIIKVFMANGKAVA